MDVDVLVNLAQWIAVLSFVVTPPVISLIKNIGGQWSKKTKQGVALALALVGSLVAYSVNVDLSAVSLSDWEGLWLPLVSGVAAMVAGQYTSFKVLWTGVLEPVNNFLTRVGDPDA